MTQATPRALVRAQIALESFRLTPDGGSVVYALRRVRRDDYESHLWRRAYRGGRARQLTRGRVRDGSPVLSPDGRRVAFVRTPVGDPDAVAQAWILPLDGGEPWPLTTRSSTASRACGGARTVAAWRSWRRPATTASSSGEQRKGRAPVARRLTRLDFRDDDSGHVVRRVHLWLVAAREGARHAS